VIDYWTKRKPGVELFIAGIGNMILGKLGAIRDSAGSYKNIQGTDYA
jgi:hypothetical protein